MKRSVIASGVIAGLAAVGTAAAGGGGPEVKVTVAPPAKADPKAAPTIVATLVGAQIVPIDKITIATAKDPTVVLRPIAMRDYAHGDEPMAIVVVVDGQEIWLGNETWAKGDDRMPGVFTPLAHALDAAKLGDALPAGSTAELVTYGTKVEVKLPMGAPAKLTGRALGAQRDYRGNVSAELAAACERALGDLHKSAASRKALVVIGDGEDVDAKAHRAKLEALRKQAQADGVEVYALVYRTEMSGDSHVVKALVPAAREISSIDDLGAGLAAIVAALGDSRYYVTFPGWDAKHRTGLPWDGKAHDLVVSLDGMPLDPVSVVLAPTWTPPAK